MYKPFWEPGTTLSSLWHWHRVKLPRPKEACAFVYVGHIIHREGWWKLKSFNRWAFAHPDRLRADIPTVAGKIGQLLQVHLKALTWARWWTEAFRGNKHEMRSNWDISQYTIYQLCIYYILFIQNNHILFMYLYIFLSTWYGRVSENGELPCKCHQRQEYKISCANFYVKLLGLTGQNFVLRQKK